MAKDARMRTLPFVAAVWLCAAATCGGTTYVVYPDGTGDFPTIQAAISGVQDGDIIELADGTFIGEGNTNISFQGKAVTVRSQAGDPELCIVDCEGQNWHRGFIFNSGEGPGSVLEGVTIKRARLVEDRWALGGRSQQKGAGVLCVNSSPVISNCALLWNTAGSYDYGGLGGGMYCGGNSSPTLADCIFRDNLTVTNGGPARGGGMYCEGGSSPTVTGCLFDHNWADYMIGCGVYCAAGASAVFSGCVFEDNDLACSDSSPALTGCLFFGWGPSLYLMNGSSPVVEDCIFRDTSGGATCQGGSPTFTGCIFWDNSWGIWCSDSSQPVIASCTLCCNDAGIMSRQGSSPDIQNTIIAFSQGGFGTDGPAVSCDETSSAALTCCDLYGNAGGDWVGCVEGQEHLNGNFSLDPFFCDRDNLDFTLCSESPCAAESNPGCGAVGALDVGCTCAPPAILSVQDVGNDQGRQVRLRWERSVYDALGDTVAVTGYGIYRRQDQYRRRVARVAVLQHEGVTTSRLDGWDYLGTAPAHGESAYQYIAPTLCDSTEQDGVCWSVFFVRAMTPEPLVFFDSPPDSGYSIDNLAPDPPAQIRGDFVPETGHLALSWSPSGSADLRYYEVHRGEGAEFVPSYGNRVYADTDTVFIDTSLEWDELTYYKVASVDFGGNRSEYAALPASTTGVGDDVPSFSWVGQTCPNPFRPEERVTQISYAVASPGGPVDIRVYNLSGDLLRVLVTEEHDPGTYVARWDGSDGQGRRVSSGVYFYRVDAPGLREHRKIVVLR